MKKTQYIIVGQGLAGTVLSFLLQEKGIEHIVITDGNLPAASLTSAGMMNPLVFKRITKSWNIDTVLPVAKEVYARIEIFLANQYVKPLMIAKIISSEQELRWWKERIESQQLHPYIDNFVEGDFFSNVSDVYKYAMIRRAASVSIANLIKDYNQFLQSNDMVLYHHFNYNNLSLHRNGVRYKDINATKIIFCEGAHAVSNPYFNFIPFYLTRGDLLKVKIDQFQSKHILVKDKFLLPQQTHYIFGSTYINTNNAIAHRSDLEKDSLIEKLASVINLPFTVQEHIYGVRPTIKDRRPVLGSHPKHNQLIVFNGLGTKGTTLAPYHALLMVEYLTENLSTFDKEISVERFI